MAIGGSNWFHGLPCSTKIEHHQSGVCLLWGVPDKLASLFGYMLQEVEMRRWFPFLPCQDPPP